MAAPPLKATSDYAELVKKKTERGRDRLLETKAGKFARKFIVVEGLTDERSASSAVGSVVVIDATNVCGYDYLCAPARHDPPGFLKIPQFGEEVDTVDRRQLRIDTDQVERGAAVEGGAKGFKRLSGVGQHGYVSERSGI